MLTPFILHGAVGIIAQKEDSTMHSTPPQPMPPDPGNRDNDQWWVAGVFYVNSNDPRLLVEKRSGLGTTFNSPPFWSPLHSCMGRKDGCPQTEKILTHQYQLTKCMNHAILLS